MKFGDKKYKREHYWFGTFALRSAITKCNNVNKNYLTGSIWAKTRCNEE